MTPTPDWLTVPQAAARAGRSQGRIHQKIQDGTLKAVKSGRDWLIEPVSLGNWIATRQPGRPWHKEQTTRLGLPTEADRRTPPAEEGADR